MYWIWPVINRIVHRDSRVETILSPVTSVHDIKWRKHKDNGVTYVSSKKIQIGEVYEIKILRLLCLRFIKRGLYLSMDAKDKAKYFFYSNILNIKR